MGNPSHQRALTHLPSQKTCRRDAIPPIPPDAKVRHAEIVPSAYDERRYAKRLRNRC